ncbi:phage distal tail protein [Actinomadura atramentaria]|uniref:phage distal tail protein n=1 Tax=Actinomadura atramentaria TaxID=1990 RepID=UPI0003A7E7EE|nr:phage tail domain-containing protein [Actinomadura atramentaria]
MPILYTPPQSPTGPPITAEKETATVTWTSRSGVETIISDWRRGFLITAGAKGLGMPQYQLYLRESGALDGDVVTGVRAKPREIFLPIAVFGADRAEALARRARLAAVLDPLSVNGGGEGILSVAEPGAQPRSIRAYYTEGMEGTEGKDEAGWNWAKFGITLHASEPYWQGVETSMRWGIGGAEETFLPIGPPKYLKVRTAQVIGTSMPISCPGDVRSYPRWTIRGPVASGARFVNQTLGVSWQLNRALAGTDVVVVDTRPRARTIVLNGTENLWPSLQPASDLWPLAPGENVVDMEVGGAGDTTSVELSFVPLYKTAYPNAALTARKA